MLIILDVNLAMRFPKIITLASVLVFAASLTQKGFSTPGENPRDWSPGLYLLLIGPLGIAPTALSAAFLFRKTIIVSEAPT